MGMRVHVADHPLITHKLTVLRDARTSSPVFRQLTEELVTLLAYEATRSVKVSPIEIQTPVTTTMGVKISEPRPIVVPILRAGLGMLEGLVKLLPTAEVGFLGMVRDETTFEPTTYAERLPDDLSDRQCFAIDPMLATGGSLGAAIQFLFDRGAKDVTAICLLGTPEGVAAIEKLVGDQDVTLVLGALDERLNEQGYIVPGLGDAGDRLYGTV
ncbi:uracil phosphoribosyltransferase [Microbacterium ginsengiterrae]